MQRSAALFLVSVLLGAAPSFAKDAEPLDCSERTAADAPVTMTVEGNATALPVAQLRKQQGLGVGDESFDVYNLALRDADSLFAPRELSISVLVAKGAPLDGKTFRLLPVKDIQKQPSPVKTEGIWLPEVQSFEVKSEPDGVDYEHGIVASARVEIGKREGATQAGRVAFCIAPGQTDDVLQPQPTRAIVVEGRFTAEASD
jgi:hypothetical protein